MSGTVEIKLVEILVAVESGTQVEAELRQVINDRLQYRAAIRQCLEVAASGRIETALSILREAYPEAAAMAQAAG